MSWESFADALVSKAMREGEFTKLPGAGKPIANLDQPYRENWWLSSYLKREELAVPCEALSLRAEVERRLQQIMKLKSERAVRREVDRLNAHIAKVNSTVTSGPSTSIGKLDVEPIVSRWRAQVTLL
jgi:hypothetical protein